MTRLLFVRHGSTPWTHDGRLQGSVDIDLSDDGRDDVARLAAAVARERPRAVVSSPLARAVSTARILTGRDPILDAAWAEHSLGEWEGRTPAEIGPGYARWRAGALVPPGGEQPADVRRRVRDGALRAAALDGPVLVVTHGGVIRAALAEFVGLTPDLLRPVDAPSLTALDVAGDGSARIASFNVTA